MEETRRAQVVSLVGKTIGGALGAGLLAIPGVEAGGHLGKALVGDGCLGMFVGVAVATALGTTLGGAGGGALAPLLLVALGRLRKRRQLP
jgi:hypothetical protein